MSTTDSITRRSVCVEQQSRTNSPSIFRMSKRTRLR